MTGRGPEAGTEEADGDERGADGPTVDGRLWVLRHGQSTANLEGRIVSLPGPRALTEVGLTALGREQAREAAARACEAGLGGPSTLVISSDYARALQTAEEFAAGLGAAPPLLDERLRERGFGEYDDGPDTVYPRVWALDAADEPQTRGVETVSSVAERVTAAIWAADDARAGRDAVLVAHGDVLQIALTIAAGRPPREHRDQPHLGNAELRALPWPPAQRAAERAAGREG